MHQLTVIHSNNLDLMKCQQQMFLEEVEQAAKAMMSSVQNTLRCVFCTQDISASCASSS